jgi:hypothetical protein
MKRLRVFSDLFFCSPLPGRPQQIVKILCEKLIWGISPFSLTLALPIDGNSQIEAIEWKVKREKTFRCEFRIHIKWSRTSTTTAARAVPME